MFQPEELFKELGAERNQVGAGIGEGSLSGFPLLSRLSDPTDDVIYEPDEVAPLWTETNVDRYAKSHDTICS